jgi:hypothetical protein
LNPGYARVRLALNKEDGHRLKSRRLPPDRVERRRWTARALWRRPPGRRADNLWTTEDLAVLGTMPDAELAGRTGRTVGAVRQKRTELSIPSARDRREREN